MRKGPHQNPDPDPDTGSASTEAAPRKIALHADRPYEGQLRYREIPPRAEDFIFENIPPELEIAAMIDENEGSLRFCSTDIDFLAGVFSLPSTLPDWLKALLEPELKAKNPGTLLCYRRSIRGVDIIPNLYHRLLWARSFLKEEQQKHTMARPSIFENKNEKDTWIAFYELTVDGICYKRYVIKYPLHIALEVKLTPDGQLFLPQIPEDQPDLKAFLLGQVRRLDLRYG